MIYMVEVEAFNTVSQSTETYYFATGGGFTTRPTDTPANQEYSGRIVEPGNYERGLFGSGTTRGEGKVGFGEIRIANPDAVFDHLIDLAFDGRPCRIYRMPGLGDFASRELLITGTIDQPTFEFETIDFRFRDRLAELAETQLTQNVYAGTTTATGPTAEGRPNDFGGQPKPLLFGRAYSIPAVAANVFDLIYQISDSAIFAVLAARDAGVPLTATGDHADIAGLRAASLSPGQYATCLAEGLIRLGGSPAGVIAVDAVGFGGGSAAECVEAIFNTAGITGLNAASVTALEAANTAPVGVWVNGTADTLSVVQDVLQSIGAYIYVDAAGEFILDRLEPASGTPDHVLGLQDVEDNVQRLATGDDGRGIPAKRVTVTYRPRYAGEAEDSFAGSVSQADRTELAREFRSASVADTGVASDRLLAPELTFDSLLFNDADADAEAARLLDIYKVRRDRLTATVSGQRGPFQLGETVQLTLNRFGFDGSRLLRIVGLVEDYANNTTELELWS
ncbi:MAG: hypothetical protein KI792_12660 [Alphaproteobacteria bacterium]|nr:hypothetical protein [Alphaproteobacteria bacterium SS10]